MKKVLGSLLLLIFLLTGVRLHAAQGQEPSIRLYVKYADGNRKDSVFMIVHMETDSPGVRKEVEQYGIDGNYFGESEACKRSDFCLFKSAKKPYHQFVFVYAGHSEISPSFELDSYHSSFDAYVDADGKVELKNTTPWFLRGSKPYSMYRTALLSVVAEILVLWLVLLVLRYPSKSRFLSGMFFANLIGLPVFFGLMELSDSAIMWFVAEAAMIAVETVFVWWFMKKAAGLGKMALLVFLLNLFSVFAGGAFHFLTTLFGPYIIQYLR